MSIIEEDKKDGTFKMQSAVVRKPQQVMANVLAGMQSKAWLVLTIKLIGE